MSESKFTVGEDGIDRISVTVIGSTEGCQRSEHALACVYAEDGDYAAGGSASDCVQDMVMALESEDDRCPAR